MFKLLQIGSYWSHIGAQTNM